MPPSGQPLFCFFVFFSSCLPGNVPHSETETIMAEELLLFGIVSFTLKREREMLHVTEKNCCSCYLLLI